MEKSRRTSREADSLERVLDAVKVKDARSLVIDSANSPLIDPTLVDRSLRAFPMQRNRLSARVLCDVDMLPVSRGT